MKNTLCYMRNRLKGDTFIIGPLGGLAAGFSILLEYKYRRPELTLYCIPRAFELIMKAVKKNKLPIIWKMLRSKYWSIFVFQLSIAMWMTVINLPKGIKNSNGLNMTVLRILFGSKH